MGAARVTLTPTLTLTPILTLPPGKPGVVLHLGSAMGLLPILSAEAGANRVYACEPHGFLAQLAQAVFSEFQITAEPNAMQIIQSKLGADRQASRMELEKLCLFVGKGGTLTAAQCDSLLGDSAALETDMLSAAIISGNVVQFNAHFARLRREAVQPIAIIRQLMGLFRAMQLTHLPSGKIDVGKLSDLWPRLCRGHMI